MPQFDVHRLANRPGLVLDCQSDLLDHLQTRFVVPLAPRTDLPSVARRLNPCFDIEDEAYVMLTQSAAAIRRRDLGPVITSLAGHRVEIVSALDVLISGV
jgi:toxin CcdB